MIRLSPAVVVAVLGLGCGGRPEVERLQSSRQELLRRALAAQAFDPAREVVHASHVCSLRIDGRWFPVLDVQELVKGVVTPRGVNTIVVLDPELALAMRLPYTAERPLFCLDDRLYVWGDLQVEAAAAEGNELTFHDHGRRLTLRHVEANDLPAVPGTRPPAQ